MTTRTCKFGCGCLLSGWDDDARKYIEAGTGGLHTKERCQEAKAKLEQKNDHGNELVTQPLRPTEELAKPPYVDHTLAAAGKGLQQYKVFSAISAQDLNAEGNNWIRENQTQIQVKLIGQLQFNDGKFAITVYYEEIGN